MGENELHAALTGQRPPAQVDWDVLPMGSFVVVTLKTVTYDPLYPLSPGQAKALARAIKAGRMVDRLKHEDMQVGWRYTPPKKNIFEARGLLELHGAKTNSGLNIPTEALPELAQILLDAANAAKAFKARSLSSGASSD